MFGLKKKTKLSPTSNNYKLFLQNNHMQRALLQQVSPCKPCADPHMNLPEKGKGWSVQCYVDEMCHSVCWHVNVFLLSVSKRTQQLESGRREQGAGVLHASLYWRGNAPCPTQVLPTRYFILLLHTTLKCTFLPAFISYQTNKTWACEALFKTI